MRWLGLLFSLAPVATLGSNFNGLARRNVTAPDIPDRQPFGFASTVTGGGNPSPNNTFVVENMMDLREALEMTTPRTIYVRGEIKGNQINETTFGDCQMYIDESPVPEFNFTQYIMSYNDTYMNAVEAAADADEEFDGMNATEYLNVLKRQNGWRGRAQDIQKTQESIDAQGNVTLIGMDSTAYLNGVSLNFNSRSNIIIRNIRISPPRDCYPSPETYPDSWNARYDAISFTTTTNAWLDGNILEDGPEPVAPENFIFGWQVDRYDGLFDVEDGSDNITFSHNIVANHHKSMLWGGGEKEADRDIGKMRFTVFGNHFVNSMSRNPLIRFGTVYIVNNVFSNYNDDEPLYISNGSDSAMRAVSKRDDYRPPFQYNIGLYNMSSVLVSGNYFDQTGDSPNDTTRIFTFNDLATPNTPATLCSPPDLSSDELSAYSDLKSLASPPSKMNGNYVNLTEAVAATFAYYITDDDDSVEGGLVQTCVGFESQNMFRTFDAAEDVLSYVKANAGQLGRNTP